MLGFIRVATASPAMRVADCDFNAEQMLISVGNARKSGAQVLLFPELGVTGYTCADLFRQTTLLSSSERALGRIAAQTRDWDGIMVIGIPVPVDGRLYNCAAVIQGGQIRGFVPKSHIPGNNEYYEPRWFAPAADCPRKTVGYAGREQPIGTDLVFEVSGRPTLAIGIEICEDLWVPIPPSSLAARAGATLLLNLSASNELIGKSDYRRSLVANQSARGLCAYAYASANPCESSTDMVFGGHMLIAEGGRILSESSRFETSGTLLFADVDTDRMVHDRENMSSFHQRLPLDDCMPLWRRIPLDPVGEPDRTMAGNEMDHDGKEAVCDGKGTAINGNGKPVRHIAASALMRPVERHPFVPDNPAVREERCSEIIAIQTAGLAKRLTHTGLKRLIVGVSGGLDSTLALIVAARTMDRLGLPRNGVTGVTMPGFGTTDRTRRNALALIAGLGAEMREIPISEAAMLHFRDIGHDPSIHNVTYENVQARERTQVLMDLANLTGALLVGTGDLSELALGWCTYNGDHMSMYAVNVGVPKTLVKYLVGWYADHEAGPDSRHILTDVLATPISPELLPPNPEGRISQKTEDVVGPYELHDFFLYHLVRYGAKPSKILTLAAHAFEGIYPPEIIRRWLRLFLKRFFAQQFKRSCLPDGPKVGTISLSPRGDWRMPSDASPDVWLMELGET